MPLTRVQAGWESGVWNTHTHTHTHIACVQAGWEGGVWNMVFTGVDGAPANIVLGGRTGGGCHSPPIDESSEDRRPPWPEHAAAGRVTTGDGYTGILTFT